MGESIKHIDLVYKLLDNAIEIVPQNFSRLILTDLPTSMEKPPMTNEGYRPDLFYCHKDLLIIGEAKTSTDVDRRHSLEQYLSYMQECSRFIGISHFIVAVPWTEFIFIKNLLRRFRKKYDFNVAIRVVNDVGRVDIL